MPSIHQYYTSLLEINNKNVPFEKAIFEEVRNLAPTKKGDIGAKRTYEQTEGKPSASSKSCDPTVPAYMNGRYGEEKWKTTMCQLQQYQARDAHIVRLH